MRPDQDPSRRLPEAEPLTVAIEAVGTVGIVSKRFLIHNPTSVAYAFQWHWASGPQAALQCRTRTGTISPGRAYEMAFEFEAIRVGVTEVAWTFEIPSQGVQVPVTFFARVAEPRVRLSVPSLNFERVLMGEHATADVQLVNEESVPFHWAFDRGTYGASADAVRAGRAPVSIEPWRGALAARSAQALQIRFTPRGEASVNLTAMCEVRHKPEPLALNIKGHGFQIAAQLCLHGQEDAILSATVCFLRGLAVRRRER